MVATTRFVPSPHTLLRLFAQRGQHEMGHQVRIDDREQFILDVRSFGRRIKALEQHILVVAMLLDKRLRCVSILLLVGDMEGYAQIGEYLHRVSSTLLKPVGITVQTLRRPVSPASRFAVYILQNK